MGKLVDRIRIDKIKLNPNQPRLQFDDDNIKELAYSIKINGLIQPIIVREIDGGMFELVAGERRLRATKMLNEKEIDAIIEKYSENKSAQVAIIENIQRENLSPIEEAVAYEKLIKIYSYTQQQLADYLGKSQSTIANKLRLLGLNEEVKNNILDKKISERHGRALLKLDQEAQKVAVSKIIENNLNVAQTEKYVESKTKEKKVKNRIKVISKNDYRLELNTIKQSLDLIKKNGVDVSFETNQNDDGVEIIIHLKK